MIETQITESRVGEHILTAIADAKQEKSSSIQFVLAPDYLQKVTFETDDGFSKGYQRTLQKWAQNPEDFEKGRAGYALEVFYKEILKKVFPNEVVCLSPSSLDNKLFKNTSPADLFIGQEIDDYSIYPLLLISSKLSEGHRATINPLLNTPEITLNAREIFQGRERVLEILSTFAFTQNPDEFLFLTLMDKGEDFINKIFEGLKYIDDNNEIEEKIGRRKVTKTLNRVIKRKTRYIRRALKEPYQRFKKEGENTIE